MRKTFLYKASVSRSTAVSCLRWLSLCQDLYNTALEQRIDAYRRCGISLSWYSQCYELPALKEVFPEYKEVGSEVLQDVLQRLDRAYKAFFRRLKTGDKPGFPRFKGRDRYDSFTLKRTGWQLEGRYLFIRKVGRFKLFLSRPVDGRIKTVTVRRTSAGKWLVAFSCDQVPARQYPEATGEVGIDVGIRSFCADSEGGTVENPLYFKKAGQILRRRQRSLSRKVKGSSRRSKARILVARVHEKVNNQRRDFLHKTAYEYVRKYKVIHIETLRIRNMVRNRLAKPILDSSWGAFFSILCAKAEEAGRTVVKVPPHGTSRVCSGCGETVDKTIAQRVHKCPHCGLIIDRDLNASINILRAGQALQALTVPLGAVD
jgi:putative transposase